MTMAEDAGAVSEKQIEAADLARLTTDIVSAYVSGNTIPASDLPQLIVMVSRGLQGIGQAPEETQPTKPAPAVPVRRSIGPDQITCLVCGKRQTMLKRHLVTAHDLTPGAYRELYGLKPDYPMVAPSYAKQRSEMALRIGLGRKQAPPHRRPRKARTKARAPEGSAEG
jgi:predicted transcriptional regulator